jgi:ribosomal protein S18 acetylase RimI-like enzyme
MINRLANYNENVSINIHSVFQNAYKIEAQLIGTDEFPPLSRNAKDIKNSKSFFYGFTENECLAAVIEITLEKKCLDIHSLTVDPLYFRKGIANKLLSYILTSLDYSKAIVETAVVNTPAINLYKKNGFEEYRIWTPDHGIKKIALKIEHAL